MAYQMAFKQGLSPHHPSTALLKPRRASIRILTLLAVSVIFCPVVTNAFRCNYMLGKICYAASRFKVLTISMSALSNEKEESIPPAIALQKAQDPLRILELAVTSPSLKRSHMTSSLFRIAKGSLQQGQADKRRLLLADQRMQELWRLATSSSQAAAPNQLTEAIWACGLLGKDFGLMSPEILTSINDMAEEFEPHQISSIGWTYERLGLDVPPSIQRFTKMYPFKVLHKCCEGLDVHQFLEEIQFRDDEIVLGGRRVQERRRTCWQADEPGITFAYSGKAMPADPWTPRVQALRDKIQELTGVRYEGVLINHYPDGRCGMKYHADPDQGTIWDYETAVVSVGDTRQFVFRKTENHEFRHIFYVSSGDCVLMYGDCQKNYQHCVKEEDRWQYQRPQEEGGEGSKSNIDHRLSFVFKKVICGHRQAPISSGI